MRINNESLNEDFEDMWGEPDDEGDDTEYDESAVAGYFTSIQDYIANEMNLDPETIYRLVNIIEHKYFYMVEGYYENGISPEDAATEMFQNPEILRELGIDDDVQEAIEESVNEELNESDGYAEDPNPNEEDAGLNYDEDDRNDEFGGIEDEMQEGDEDWAAEFYDFEQSINELADENIEDEEALEIFKELVNDEFRDKMKDLFNNKSTAEEAFDNLWDDDEIQETIRERV